MGGELIHTSIIKSVRHDLVVPPMCSIFLHWRSNHYHLLVRSAPRPWSNKPAVLCRLVALDYGITMWKLARDEENLRVDEDGEAMVGIFGYEDPRMVEKIQEAVDEVLKRWDQ